MTTNPQSRLSFEDINDLDDGFLLGETDQEISLSSSNDHLAMTDHMVSQARRSIRIFTRELDPLLYDRGEFANACKQLALRSRYARIEILAFESQAIIRKGHRMVDLARRLSSRIEIREPEIYYEKHLQTFITFDEKAYIYRSYADRFEGVANFNDSRETRELEKLFKEIWLRSHVDTEMRNLNI